jgi:hypothetical protein
MIVEVHLTVRIGTKAVRAHVESRSAISVRSAMTVCRSTATPVDPLLGQTPAIGWDDFSLRRQLDIGDF